MGKKFLKAVGASDNDEVKHIMIRCSVNQVCTLVDSDLFGKFKEKFFWKDDEEIVEAIKEERFNNGPFQFIVLVFEVLK